jgi:hypothetical protein
MESPFDNTNNQICSLYLEPILNSYYKTYQNVLTVSNLPAGPLSNLVMRVNTPKLSPFQSFSAFSPPPTARSQMCLLALSRYPNTNNPKCGNEFMYAADIPNVIGFLESNQYKLMTDITNLAYRSPVDFASPSPGEYGRRRFIFMFKYEGK